MPTWQGYIFIALGVAVAALTPTLVRLNLRAIRALNRLIIPIQLRLLGVKYEMPDADTVNNSALGKWQRFSYWFGFLFMATLFVVFGVGVVLTAQAAHQMPPPR